MDTNNIQFYKKNVLRGLPNWTIFDNATVVDDSIVISGGGHAGCSLSSSYASGLNASLYRRVSIALEVDTSELSNYQNFVELVLIGTYVNSENGKINTYKSVNIAPLKSSIISGKIETIRVIGMQNMNLMNCTVYVINHTDTAIKLTRCEMWRSQDISTSQLSENFGFAVTLKDVKDHANCAELFYDGVDDSDKLFWVTDTNDAFAGINVNNENLIRFSRDDKYITM